MYEPNINSAAGDPAGNINNARSATYRGGAQARAGSLARFSGRGAGAALYQ